MEQVTLIDDSIKVNFFYSKTEKKIDIVASTLEPQKNIITEWKSSVEHGVYFRNRIYFSVDEFFKILNYMEKKNLENLYSFKILKNTDSDSEIIIRFFMYVPNHESDCDIILKNTTTNNDDKYEGTPYDLLCKIFLNDETPKKLKTFNFVKIKLGDKIKLFDQDVISFTVKSLNYYENFEKIKNLYCKKFRRDEIKIFFGTNSLINVIYNLIAGFFDSNDRKLLVEKFENNKEVCLLDFMGDFNNFSGFVKEAPGIWKVIISN